MQKAVSSQRAPSAKTNGLQEETLDPRIPAQGGEDGAKPCGHYAEGEVREVVYSIEATLPALHSKSWLAIAKERVLLWDTRGAETCVRAILPLEIWQAHGGGKAEWKRLTEEGFDASTFVAWALRASPPKLAKEVVMRCIESLWGRAD